MSVSSVIRGGLGSTPSDLVRLGLDAGTPAAAAGPIITLGLNYSPSAIIRLGLGGAPVAPGPTPPSGVSATATGATTATVVWTDNSADETGFEVQQRTAAGPGAWVAAIGDANPGAPNVVSFAVTTLTGATAYDFRVKAKGSLADSAWAPTSSSITTDNPGGGGAGIPTFIDPGRADETDTAYALAAIKIRAIGRADEVDTAPALTFASPGTIPVGVAIETDTAYAPSLAPVTGGTGGATAAQVWGYVMSNGQTAEANVLAILAGLQAGTFGVDVQYMNGAEVIGDGSEANKWRAVGVPN